MDRFHRTRGFHGFGLLITSAGLLLAGCDATSTSSFGKSYPQQAGASGIKTSNAALAAPISVSIWAPVNNSSIAPNTWTTLTSIASGGSGVVSLSYYINGSLFCTALTSPFNCSYLTPSQNQTIQLQAVATDSNGVSGSAQISFNVGSGSPAPAPAPAAPINVSIWAPASGGSLPPNMWTTFTSVASGGSGTISSLSYYVNGALFCTALTSPFNCSYNTPAQSQTITLKAVATDSNGATGSAQISFNVGSGPVPAPAPAPTNPIHVSIWAPANGSSLAAGTWTTLTSVASGGNGTISTLSYYINDTLWCTARTSPFNCSYQTPAQSQTITLKAVATDSSGATGSAQITFDVTGSAPVPTGAGVTYYVSPSGNDANSGTSPSAAWQSIAKVNASHFNGGDVLLFQGGATFTGCLDFNSSNVASSVAAPFTVSSYGTGKFVIQANCSGNRTPAVAISSVSGIVFQNAQLVGNGGGAETGIYIKNYSQTIADTITIQNCDISGFYTNNAASYGAEVFVDGSYGAGLNHVNVLNNSLHGASVSSPDENGITGFGGGKNIKNVVYSGNQLYNLGGHANGINGAEGNGIIANGVDGGVIQFNVAHDIGANVNTCGGGAGLWSYNSNNITLQFNEAYNIRPTSYSAGCDWNGYDLDGDVTNSVMQYNYSHDNFGAGYLSYVAGTWGPNAIRFNVSAHDALMGSTAEGPISVGGSPNDAFHVDIYNNTVYNTAHQGLPKQVPDISFTNVTNASGLIANNLFYSVPNAWNQNVVTWVNGGDPSGMRFLNNAYLGSGSLFVLFGAYNGSFNGWQSATGQDPRAITGVDPMLVNTSFGVCGAAGGCPSGFQLQSGSPMIGAGIDLGSSGINVGSRDYYNLAVPSGIGTGFNIGAY